MPGIMLSVEGIDGSGKGTNTRKIKEYLELQGYKVKMYSFPLYETTSGKIISKYLRGEFGDIDKVPYELICSAYAANRVSIQKQLEQELYGINQYDFIIMDRYTYSNLFTAAKLPEDQWGLFIKWIEDLEFGDMGIKKPHYNFYLYVDPNISIQRIEERGKREYQEGKEDIHENNKQLLINTAKCYLNFAQGKDNWFVINQMVNGKQLNPNDVFLKIKEKLDYIIRTERWLE
jgi:dTMP kinase